MSIVKVNYIYVIVNPKWKGYSLINITDLLPEKINKDFNLKHTNSNEINDFYRVVYKKKIKGDIVELLKKLQTLLINYRLEKSEFYKISPNSVIELIEKEFFKENISDEELIIWWNSLNDSWKYTFEKKIFPKIRQNEQGEKLDQIKVEELRKISNINNLSIHRDGIKSLAPLRMLKELKKLNCSISHINDLSPLSQLYKLEELNIVDTEVESLKPISGLLNLKNICFFRTNITSLEGILHITTIEKIFFDRQRIPKKELEILEINNPKSQIG